MKCARRSSLFWRHLRSIFLLKVIEQLGEGTEPERKCVAKEPTHLLAIIGRRVAAYQLACHNMVKTPCGRSGAQHYVCGMAAFHPLPTLEANSIKLR